MHEVVHARAQLAVPGAEVRLARRVLLSRGMVKQATQYVQGDLQAKQAQQFVMPGAKPPAAMEGAVEGGRGAAIEIDRAIGAWLEAYPKPQLWERGDAMSMRERFAADQYERASGEASAGEIAAMMRSLGFDREVSATKSSVPESEGTIDDLERWLDVAVEAGFAFEEQPRSSAVDKVPHADVASTKRSSTQSAVAKNAATTSASVAAKSARATAAIAGTATSGSASAKSAGASTEIAGTMSTSAASTSTEIAGTMSASAASASAEIAATTSASAATAKTEGSATATTASADRASTDSATATSAAPSSNASSNAASFDPGEPLAGEDTAAEALAAAFKKLESTAPALDANHLLELREAIFAGRLPGRLRAARDALLALRDPATQAILGWLGIDVPSLLDRFASGTDGANVFPALAAIPRRLTRHDTSNDLTWPAPTRTPRARDLRFAFATGYRFGHRSLAPGLSGPILRAAFFGAPGGQLPGETARAAYGMLSQLPGTIGADAWLRLNEDWPRRDPARARTHLHALDAPVARSLIAALFPNGTDQTMLARPAIIDALEASSIPAMKDGLRRAFTELAEHHPRWCRTYQALAANI